MQINLAQDSIHLLNEIVDILEKLKINYFLTDGTILGLYREQKFIEHDNDIDIALIDNKKIFSLYIKLLKSDDTNENFNKEFSCLSINFS